MYPEKGMNGKETAFMYNGRKISDFVSACG